MKWNDVRVGKKIYIASGSILLLLFIVVCWSVLGLTKNLGEIINFSSGAGLRSELQQREVDHLNWAKALTNFITNENAGELTIQLDHTQCGFGKWYYGDGRKEAEKMLPSLASDLLAIEEPHKKLHGSAHRIKEIFKRSDAHLPEFLTQKELDHVAWTNKVQDAIITRQTKLEVQLDPKKCGFGEFLYGESGKKMSESDQQYARLLKEIEAPHARLHDHGQEVARYLAGADFQAASTIYNKEIVSDLKEIRQLLNQIKQRALENLKGRRTAEQIFFTETQGYLGSVQSHLGKMMKLATEYVQSNEQTMMHSARTTRVAVVIFGLIALVLGLLFSMFIGRSISRPIENAVQINERLSDGDLTLDITVDRQDEVGQMLATMKRMLDRLKATIRDIKVAADQVTSGSQELSNSSQEVSRGAGEQASSVDSKDSRTHPGDRCRVNRAGAGF